MKRSAFNKSISYILTPILLVAVAVGIWASVNAALMNYKLSRSIDQILNIASIARDFSADQRLSLEIATNKFIDRLTEWGLPVQPGPNGRNRVVLTPWDQPMQFVYSPKMKLMRLETLMSSVVCQKLLVFMSNDPVSIGLRRVDVNTSSQVTLWRTVYQDEQTEKKIDPRMIKISCGRNADVIVGLNFQTR